MLVQRPDLVKFSVVVRVQGGWDVNCGEKEGMKSARETEGKRATCQVILLGYYSSLWLFRGMIFVFLWSL